MKNPYKPIILITDDETAILQTLKQALEDENFQVHTLDKPEHLLTTLGKLVPDVLLLDVFMPNFNGIELLNQIKQEYPQQKIMMISGFGNISLAIQALKCGADDFIEKPFNLDELLAKLSFLHEEQEANSRVTSVDQKPTDDFVGTSYTSQELLRQARQIAPLDLPILIQGEVGSGKTKLARYIHSASKRNELKIIDALTTTDSNLVQQLNHIFPSFSGTLLIKNIDCLSSENQTILAGLLVQGSQLRLVTTSNRQLFKLNKENSFNTHLFQILNCIPLEVPPLRKHPYDIPLLADHFLQIFNEKHNRSIVLNTAAIRSLRNAAWPQNVVQLKQAVEKVVTLCPQDHHVVAPDDLIKFLGEQHMEIVQTQSMHSFESLEHATKAFEKKYITYLLKKNHYNLEQVCDLLDMQVAELKDKLHALQINA